MRVLTQVAVSVARAAGAKTRTITLHWQPVDDLAGAYVETLTFDGPTRDFARARAHYEALHQAHEPVPDPWS